MSGLQLLERAGDRESWPWSPGKGPKHTRNHQGDTATGICAFLMLWAGLGAVGFLVTVLWGLHPAFSCSKAVDRRKNRLHVVTLIKFIACRPLSPGSLVCPWGASIPATDLGPVLRCVCGGGGDGHLGCLED